jgi:nondiscriminating aspartyl-tRNA synthetase
VLVRQPVERQPDRGGAESLGRSQYFAPVLAHGERHPGGRQRLELRSADMVRKEPKQLRRVRMGSHLVHGICPERQSPRVAEPVHPTKDRRDVGYGHGPVLPAPGPAVLAYGGTAHHFQLPVDYVGRPAYLAQSPQFYKQIMVGVYERVFEIGPVFRAEPHDTPRHLNEYVSLDFEMGFIQDHTTVMAMLTDVLHGMLEAVPEQAPEAVALLNLALPEVPSEIPTIHFTEAQQLIAAGTGEDVEGQPDLAPAHERWLGDWARQTYGTEFLFVVGYPMTMRPFYTHPQPDRPACSNSFDLLFRGLELVTGGQRLHRYEEYLTALAARGLSPDPFTGYLDAFAHGMPPHGGCALGLERWVARLVDAANIRETTLFPRDINRLTP